MNIVLMLLDSSVWHFECKSSMDPKKESFFASHPLCFMVFEHFAFILSSFFHNSN